MLHNSVLYGLVTGLYRSLRVPWEGVLIGLILWSISPGNALAQSAGNVVVSGFGYVPEHGPGDVVVPGFRVPVSKPPTDALRHEPLFGIGPRTIWKNGFGLEVGIDRDKSRREDSRSLEYEVLYGLTTNWAVTLETRQVLDQSQAGDTGFGDLLLRTKYRFYKKDVPGGVYHAAVMGGVELPTGASGLSSESTDLFMGLSGAYEGRRWLVFVTGRYRVNTKGSNNIKRGNVFLYDVALGLRPVKTDYYMPDLVLMAELNGQIFGENEASDIRAKGSSGDRLLAGFGAWATYRNWAFKPGIQIPVYNNLKDGDLDYHLVVAVELHI